MNVNQAINTLEVLLTQREAIKDLKDLFEEARGLDQVIRERKAELDKANKELASLATRKTKASEAHEAYEASLRKAAQKVHDEVDEVIKEERNRQFEVETFVKDRIANLHHQLEHTEGETKRKIEELLDEKKQLEEAIAQLRATKNAMLEQLQKVDA